MLLAGLQQQCLLGAEQKPEPTEKESSYWQYLNPGYYFWGTDNKEKDVELQKQKKERVEMEKKELEEKEKRKLERKIREEEQRKIVQHLEQAKKSFEKTTTAEKLPQTEQQKEKRESVEVEEEYKEIQSKLQTEEKEKEKKEKEASREFKKKRREEVLKKTPPELEKETTEKTEQNIKNINELDIKNKLCTLADNIKSYKDKYNNLLLKKRSYAIQMMHALPTSSNLENTINTIIDTLQAPSEITIQETKTAYLHEGWIVKNLHEKITIEYDENYYEPYLQYTITVITPSKNENSHTATTYILDMQKGASQFESIRIQKDTVDDSPQKTSRPGSMNIRSIFEKPEDVITSQILVVDGIYGWGVKSETTDNKLKPLYFIKTISGKYKNTDRLFLYNIAKLWHNLIQSVRNRLSKTKK